MPLFNQLIFGWAADAALNAKKIRISVKYISEQTPPSNVLCFAKF